MTDKVTELVKKHGAEVYMLGKRDAYLDQNRISMTSDQLRAIIREASAPLVEALRYYEDKRSWHKDSQQYGSFEVSDYNITYNDFYEQNQATRYAGNRAKNALAEFNRDFGDD